MGILSYSFFSKEEGISVLSTHDEFLNSLNQENLKFYIRGVNNKESDQVYSVEDYKQLVAKSCLDFPERRKEKIRYIVDEINVVWQKLELPNLTISFIDTNGEEAFGLPYTRQSSIILPRDLKSTPRDSILDYLNHGLISHEIFHILSRTHPQVKAKLYRYFGFKTINHFNGPHFLVNPDAPVYDQSIELSTKDGKVFDGVLNIHIEEDRLEWKEIWNLQTSEFVNFKETNLVSIIGKNTEYIIHPEEICAEHFRLLFVQAWNKSHLIKTKDNPYSKYLKEIRSKDKLAGFFKILNDFKF